MSSKCVRTTGTKPWVAFGDARFLVAQYACLGATQPRARLYLLSLSLLSVNTTLVQPKHNYFVISQILSIVNHVLRLTYSAAA